MDKRIIFEELRYKAVKSSGSGGQHVNKVSTKIQLHFNIENTKGLNPQEILLLKQRLHNRINQKGNLVLSSDAFRSQLKNKKEVTSRFFELLEISLKLNKIRKSTSIPFSIKIKRRDNKLKQSQKKQNRKPPKLD